MLSYSTDSKSWLHILINEGSVPYSSIVKKRVSAELQSSDHHPIQEPTVKKVRRTPILGKKCQICDRRVGLQTPWEKVCRYHIIVKPNETMYVCRNCRVNFTVEDELIEHTKQCRPTSCLVCGYNPEPSVRKGRPSQSSLLAKIQRHMLVHAKEKPFVCEICGQGFTQPQNLRGHMRQHTGEKPYVCEHCGLSFTHKISLRKHFCKTLKRRVEPLDWKQEGVGRRKTKKS